ncbi:MAG: M24 family metallopeptidase, partial [Chlorobium sp.]|nr:M24 family metallopeptidase [Chlorobium sp.]
SDITRTIPVGGKFNTLQKDIYAIVLATEEDTIRKIKPGIKYADLHHQASLQITQGLIDLKIMKGVGHFPMLEKPDLFNKVLEETINKL